MPKGVSVYLGLNYQLQAYLDYLQSAKEHGFTKIFTSLHIPEADYSQIFEEFKVLLDFASQLEMDVMADISPRTFKYFGWDIKNLKPIRKLGLYGIRVDFGFSPGEIAEYTHNPYGLKVEINASTVTEKFLEEFALAKPDYGNLQACHNYYPRPNTGISELTLEVKNRLLKSFGIGPIAAFIPSLTGRRGPLFEGLPTLEIHRYLEPEIAAKHLFALGVDDVFFGDGIPSLEEVESVGGLDQKVLQLRIITLNPNKVERGLIFGGIHHNRPDVAEDVIRSIESREWLTDPTAIVPHDNLSRRPGDVTIDNQNYLRYCGELQICLKELPADPRTNVVGRVIEEERFLLKYLREEVPFKFEEWGSSNRNRE